MFYIWFTIALVLGIIEISTCNLVSIWFVISALVAMLTTFITDSLYIQIAVFVILGIVLIPISKKL